MITLAACQDLGPETPRDELQENLELWQAMRPARYAYTIERQCFCGVDARGPVRVTVEGETVLSQVYVEDGRLATGPATGWFPSVDGLFALLRDAIDEGAHEVRVSYDPVSGVPFEFWIDYSEFTADEELGFAVTEAVQPVS
jgi:hypothetical protein